MGSKNVFKEYSKELIDKGLIKVLYEDEMITFCNISDQYYYVFENNIGLGISVLKKKSYDIIDNPQQFFQYYCTLSDRAKDLISVSVKFSNFKEIVTKLYERTLKEGPADRIDHQFEDELMKHYGMKSKRR